MAGGVEIAQVQQITVFFEDFAAGIAQGVGHAAHLGAFATVCAAAHTCLAGAAAARIADAESPVDETFHRDIDSVADVADFGHRQFAGQYQLGESDLLQESGLGDGARIALRAGMQRNGRYIHA